jgi:hypothetical protein
MKEIIKSITEKDISPILSIIIGISFICILLIIRKTKQLSQKDKEGLISFALIFATWSLQAIMQLIMNRYNAYTLLVIRAIFSTFNSFFILKGISSIETTEEYWFRNVVKRITSNFWMIGLLITFLVISIVFVSLFHGIPGWGFLKDPNYLIWLPDTVYSLLALCIFLVVMIQAFNERKIRFILWIVYIVFALILLRQLLELYNAHDESYKNTSWFISLTAIISASYKTILCMLILVLLYSYKLKRDSSQFATIEFKYLPESKKKKEKFFIIYTPPESTNGKEIPYTMTVYKRFLKAAIHNKLGANDNNQTLICSKDQIPGEGSEIGYRDITDINNNIKQIFSNVDTIFTSEKYDKEIRYRLNIPKENIFLPEITKDDLLNEILKVFYKEFDILNRKR